MPRQVNMVSLLSIYFLGYCWLTCTQLVLPKVLLLLTGANNLRMVDGPLRPRLLFLNPQSLPSPDGTPPPSKLLLMVDGTHQPVVADGKYDVFVSTSRPIDPCFLNCVSGAKGFAFRSGLVDMSASKTCHAHFNAMAFLFPRCGFLMGRDVVGFALAWSLHSTGLEDFHSIMSKTQSIT